MVSPHDAGAELVEQFKGFAGLGAFADHVPDEDEAVVARHELEAKQQLRQFVGAAVNVAYDEAARFFHDVGSATSILRCEGSRVQRGCASCSLWARAAFPRPRSWPGSRTETRRFCRGAVPPRTAP